MAPARCSGGPGKRRVRAGAANTADAGGSAAEQLAEAPLPQSRAAQQQQVAEEGRPLLQEAIRLLQEAQVGSAEECTHACISQV